MRSETPLSVGAGPVASDARVVVCEVAAVDSPAPACQQELERLVLACCLESVPDLDDVSVTVRRQGKVVRFLLLRPPPVTGVCASTLLAAAP
jgi:hypothetical protein